MATQTRAAPLFGALIAAATALYAARHADAPAMPRPAAPARSGWGRILANFWAELDHDHISVMAAGVAFYAFLSIFPAMSALISLYALAADPQIIERQVASMSGLLPQAGLNLLSDQLHALIAAPPGKLGIGLAVSLALALWSATSGTGTLMQALTVAYEEDDPRDVIVFYGQAIGLTVAIGGVAPPRPFLLFGVPAGGGLLPRPPARAGRAPPVRLPRPPPPRLRR